VNQFILNSLLLYVALENQVHSSDVILSQM